MAWDYWSPGMEGAEAKKGRPAAMLRWRRRHRRWACWPGGNHRGLRITGRPWDTMPEPRVATLTRSTNCHLRSCWHHRSLCTVNLTVRPSSVLESRSVSKISLRPPPRNGVGAGSIRHPGAGLGASGRPIDGVLFTTSKPVPRAPWAWELCSSASKSVSRLLRNRRRLRSYHWKPGGGSGSPFVWLHFFSGFAKFVSILRDGKGLAPSIFKITREKPYQAEASINDAQPYGGGHLQLNFSHQNLAGTRIPAIFSTLTFTAAYTGSKWQQKCKGLPALLAKRTPATAFCF